MMNLRGKNICDFAIAVFGKTEQENMCMEECAELIQAINKKHRGEAHNLAEEIADNLLKNGVIVPPVKKGDTKNEIPRSIRNYKR